MFEMIVKQVGVNGADGHPVVVLGDSDGERMLPIWIGPAELKSISLAFNKCAPSRPQTHDLLVDVIRRLKRTVARLEISEIADSTFYAKLWLKPASGKGKEVAIDCRPSDGIAIALRCEAPILVAQEVLAAASFKAEKDEDTREKEEFQKFLSTLKASDFAKMAQEHDDDNPKQA